MELPKYFYPLDLPLVNSIVFAHIVDNDKIGLKCTLPEFNGKYAFCSLSNFSENEVIKRNEKDAYFEVLESKDNIIELSRFGLRKDNLKKAQENFMLSKKIYNFFKKWSIKLQTDLITEVLWKNFTDEMPFYSELIKDTKWLDNMNEGLVDEFYSIFIEQEDLSIVFQMLITHEMGVDIIYKIYDAAIACSTENVKLEIRYHAKNGDVGSLYTLYVDSAHENAHENAHESAKKVLEKTIKVIEKKAIKYGKFKIGP